MKVTAELIPHGELIQFSLALDGARYVGDFAPGMPEYESALARCREPRPVHFAGPPPITWEMDAARVVGLGERYPTRTRA